MATNLTKAQLAALDVLKARLNPQDPGFRGGDEKITAALEAGRLYIDTWVLPLIDALQNDSWERKETLRSALYDAAIVRHARTTDKALKGGSDA